MTPEEEAKYEELSRKAEAGELTVIPGTRMYGEKLVQKMLADAWDGGYTNGVFDQRMSDETGQSVWQMKVVKNPYKKETNDS